MRTKTKKVKGYALILREQSIEDRWTFEVYTTKEHAVENRSYKQKIVPIVVTYKLPNLRS